jgi:L-ascorbate metabolism protein UlaG (beta-lactamase superfamily)
MAELAQQGEQLLNDIAGTQTEPGQGAFWWMGQHTFIIKAGGKVIYIDPWFDPVEGRHTPAPLAMDAPFQADYVLVSHGHSDHLCPATLRGIGAASPNALFISPKTEALRMMDEGNVSPTRLHALNASEVYTDSHIHVTAVKAKHEEFDEHPTLGFPYLGYVVRIGGISFYHAGDSIYYDGLTPHLKTFGALNAVFLPINGRNAALTRRGWAGNFTYQEAVEIAGELRPGISVPTHYDMFSGNQEDPTRFTDYLDAKYPGNKWWVGKAGEKVVF